MSRTRRPRFGRRVRQTRLAGRDGPHSPYDELLAFLGNTAPDKREKLVDRLLTSEGFVDKWTFTLKICCAQDRAWVTA
jgi:hypothetical protein